MAYQLSKEAKVNFVPFKNFLDKIILNLQQTVILRVITYNLEGQLDSTSNKSMPISLSELETCLKILNAMVFLSHTLGIYNYITTYFHNSYKKSIQLSTLTNKDCSSFGIRTYIVS